MKEQQSLEINYEVITRPVNYIILIREQDTLIGSLTIDSDAKLEQWKEKMNLISTERQE